MDYAENVKDQGELKIDDYAYGPSMGKSNRQVNCWFLVHLLNFVIVN